MQRHRRVVADPTLSVPVGRERRVALTRETLWQVADTFGTSGRDLTSDQGARAVFSGYAVYSDVRDEPEFEEYVMPVLRTLAASRANSMLVLTETSETFDAGRLRRAMQIAEMLGVRSMVEIAGSWGATLLELLAATMPTYVRLSPDMVRGAASVPDLFRSLVALGEFARERSLELVVRNPVGEQELDAVRRAGVGLVQWADLPIATRYSV